jgi:asparagine synthetase B (glutamine-hydrolysing)
MVSPIELHQPSHIANLNSEQQADEIERLLDSILEKHIRGQEDPVLLFSGGVDSGIIASRLAALGYRNSLLLNYSFGEDDVESKLAEAMANQLGLKFKRVPVTRRFCNCLKEPGKIYPQPFGDHSTVPTSDLAYSVVEYLSNRKCLILDGTGADAAFGKTAKIEKWKKLRRVPSIAKKIASYTYMKMLWHREGRIEKTARILRRSIEMPLLSAILAQNSFAGVFYRKDNRHLVDQFLETWIGGWAGEEPVKKVIAAVLAFKCANIIGQKGKPIFELAGHKVLYPFLEFETISTALCSIPYWQMEEPKAPLKTSLARCVPFEMVYRPKSGFIDPKGNVFFSEEFINYLRSVTEPASPISHLLDKKLLLKSCDFLTRKKTLPAQTLNFLWAVVFTDRWYRTVFS